MRDNSYAFIIDCSLDKKGKIIIYELQPLIVSGLGGEQGVQQNAFQKAFPKKSISIEHFLIDIHDGNESIFIQKCQNITDREFTQDHTYRFTPSEYEISQLDNKVHQRLYLPNDVSPEHIILDLSLNSDELTNNIIQHFQDKNIEQIVLKHPSAAVGQGNIFLSDLNDKDKIKEGIEKLKGLQRLGNGLPSYLLAEEQRIFSRISRKTKELKDGHLTFRIVGIASRDGILGYFIATKSLSEEVNSHSRKRMKRFFGNNYKTIDSDNAGNEWQTTYVGPKDKYFNIGERKIPIKEEVMQEIFKAAYNLYHDIKCHTKEEFQEHVANCVRLHNKIPFMDTEFQKSEIVEKNDFTALLYACEAMYYPLKKKIKDEVDCKSLDLYTINDMVDSIYGPEFEVLLRGIEIQNKFDVLELIIVKHNLAIEELLATTTKHGHLNIIKYLIENKSADQNLEIENLLNIAAEHGHLNIVQYLIEEKGADKLINIHQLMEKIIYSSCDNVKVIRYLIDERKCVKLNEEPYTRLLSEKAFFCLSKIKYFIEEKGFDINDHNKEGNTILHNVLERCNHPGDKFIAIIKFLVHHPKINLNKENNRRMTALLVNMLGYHVNQVIKIMLHAYADSGIKLNDMEQAYLGKYTYYLEYYNELKNRENKEATPSPIVEYVNPKTQIAETLTTNFTVSLGM